MRRLASALIIDPEGGLFAQAVGLDWKQAQGRAIRLLADRWGMSLRDVRREIEGGQWNVIPIGLCDYFRRSHYLHPGDEAPIVG